MLRSKPGRAEGRTATVRPVSYADSISRAKVSASVCDIGRFRPPLRCSPERASERFPVPAWDAEYLNSNRLLARNLIRCCVSHWRNYARLLHLGLLGRVGDSGFRATTRSGV